MRQMPAMGLGRKGLHAPCVFWPSSYIPQEIECVVASPDGRVVAATCASGQVYIWHCAYNARGHNLRLDPKAVALCGWLGPAKILGVDFCRLERASAELAGLSSGLLLVCLLAGGRLRLLDTADGRCVADISARPNCQDPTAAVAQVLQDGRHLVLAGCSSEPSVVDLWPGRVVATLATQGDCLLLRLAAPSRSLPVTSDIDCGPARCLVAGASADTVFVWRWLSSGAKESAEPVVPFFSFNYVRGTGRYKGNLITLSLEGGVLLLGMTECVLLWSLHQNGARPYVQVHFPSGAATAGLCGASLLELVSDGCGPNETSGVHSSRRYHRRRARASSSSSFDLRRPEVRGGAGVACSRLVIMAWNAVGDVFRGDADDPAAIESRTLVVEKWGSLPKGLDQGCVLFFSLGSLIVCGVSSLHGDDIHMKVVQAASLNNSAAALCGKWARVVSLKGLWKSNASLRGDSVTCAAVVDFHQCLWLVLGLAGTTGRVCAVSCTGASSRSSLTPGGETVHILPTPEGFNEPTCLLALGNFNVAVGDSHGLVCGWALPEWRLKSTALSAYRVPVVSLVRVWTPQPTDISAGEGILMPEALVVAALDELGRCRVINLELGEVLCTLQSQTDSFLWIDEPFRITYDRVGRYLCTATPSTTSVWDACSGAFMGNVLVSCAGAVDSVGAGTHETDKSQEGSTPGFRCPTLRTPSFGVEAVAWQVAGSAGGDSQSLPTWRLGEAFLDGPNWRLPVLLFSPSQLVAKTVENVGRSAASGNPSPAAPATTSENDCLKDSLANAVAAECNAWERGSLADALRSVGLRLSGPVCVFGVMGVDDSISFPLPRRRGASQRSASPALRRRATEKCRSPRKDTAPASTFSCEAHGNDLSSHATCFEGVPCTASTSQELLQASLPDCDDVPHIALAIIVRLLMHSEVAAAPQVLQRWVLPTLRRILRNASLPPLMRVLDAWAKVLNREPPATKVTPSAGAATFASSQAATFVGSHASSQPAVATSNDAMLRHCAFGSAALLKDAATMVLALVAHLEPRLFEKLCPRRTAGSVAEALCLRMFTRLGGMQLQSISCEAFALGFPLWRQHLAAALPKRPSAYNRNTPSGSALTVAGASSSGTRATHLMPPNASGNRGADGARSPSPDPVNGLPDEDLEWLTVQVLALYQEPRVAPSCLSVMMQVGVADPATLLNVMGKAARRLDLGASYASSALLVLVAFIHRSAARVLPLLPKFTEAVLRCLEPSDPALRRQSLYAVTSALHELVQTFPMVSFHQPSQKFAVGTGDGLVIVYDLRTATKWRILEGHTGPLSAIAFSRDGSQLSSYSSRDSSIRIWQCSSTGFLGGLLGSSGRCLKQHGLPPCAPRTSMPETSAGNANNWRGINLSWTERGQLRLVRETGETMHLTP